MVDWKDGGGFVLYLVLFRYSEVLPSLDLVFSVNCHYCCTLESIEDWTSRRCNDIVSY